MTDPRCQPPGAAYVHVPFCRHRCGYCNFTLVAGRDDLVERYLSALERELATLEMPRPVDTLYVGGGTPTHLAPPQLARLLALLRRWFPLRDGGELTVEANPRDLDAARAAVLAEAAVDRISLGAQSFQTEKLRLLERDHAADDVRQAVRQARTFARSVSLDLIFGVPGETPQGWLSDLEAAVELAPEHLSTYGLTFERGTAFWSRRLRGELTALNEEAEGELYAAAIERLEAEGFEHYEVSSFARPGRQSRHNHTYWDGRGYYAAGPGAARYVDGRREVNHRSTTTYLHRVLSGQSPVAEVETLPDVEVALERVALGLRRLAGVDLDRVACETGVDLASRIRSTLDALVEWGVVARQGTWIRLTRRGLFVADAVCGQVLRAAPPAVH